MFVPLDAYAMRIPDYSPEVGLAPQVLRAADLTSNAQTAVLTTRARSSVLGHQER